MFAWLATIRKFLVSAVGGAVTALTLIDKIPFLPHTVTGPVGIVLAVLTPILTYLVPNKTPAA